jgi:CubicO group peptidase (beta-lactamase class C family)
MRRGTAIHFEAHGFRDVEKAIPMTTDTIFRIASMSKALTSVAAMILVEEGIVALEHPVSRYVEAFRKTNVALRPPRGSWEGAPISVVPAKREITIRDLLTHTAGLGYGFGAAATEWKAAGIQNWYFADRAEPVAAVVERMAALPFDAQPGEAYVYGYATDVLGVVVERASGRSLDAFITERITKPLKMVDTHFFLPRTKRDRLATVYAAKPGGPIERAPEGPAGQGAYVDGPRQAFSGGAGLLSTASDYARFLSMLANGGALDGVRILGRKTVELMRQNHVGSLYNEGRVGFGLGFEVVEHLGRAGRYGSETAYGWGSAYDSNYWVDPVEDMMGIYLSQLLPNGGLDLQMKFRTLAYAALVK